MTNLKEERQAAIAHDLAIITDLMGHHAIILAAASKKKAQQIKMRNIAWRFESIYKELKTLEKQMQSLGKKEYPGAAWLSNYDRGPAEKKDAK